MSLPPCNIQNPKDFGRVAVLFGGDSSEREISLLTGEAVLSAMEDAGIDARGLDSLDMLAELSGFDRVWIALHGSGGEDGKVQGVLEHLKLPYTGSGVMASALCMDKLRSKQLFAANEVATPPFRVIDASTNWDDLMVALGLPIMVKPATEGSSVGMTKVNRKDDLEAALKTALEFDATVLAEAWVAGADYTVSILQGCALASIKIEPATEFYDYQAKYFSDTTQYSCPSDLNPNEERLLGKLGLKAFDVLGARGWGRVDFMLDRDHTPWCLEVNTIPGMTSHSLVPMAAKQAGVDFQELVWRILETSYEC